MNRISRLSSVQLIALAASVVVCTGLPVLAAGELSGWHASFEELSKPASNAMELSVAQIEALLIRCEVLKRELDSFDESARKVYGRRLQMTCDLYRFMLESKRAAAAGEATK